MSTKLLTTNTKLRKGSRRYQSRGVSLLPHKLSGKNLCPEAGYCSSMCVLWFSGRQVTKPVRQAMETRTRLFLEDRKTFLARLGKELGNFIVHCRKLRSRCCVRLNVGSDLPWETITPDLFETHPTVTFYDYTKIKSRALAYVNDKFPPNYHITYSINERTPQGFARQILESGGNCTLVVDAAWYPQRGIAGPIPSTIEIDGKQFPVVDGDTHDVRIPELDGHGVVILLRSKGGTKRAIEGVKAGFVRSVPHGRYSQTT